MWGSELLRTSPAALRSAAPSTKGLCSWLLPLNPLFFEGVAALRRGEFSRIALFFFDLRITNNFIHSTTKKPLLSREGALLFWRCVPILLSVRLWRLELAPKWILESYKLQCNAKHHSVIEHSHCTGLCHLFFPRLLRRFLCFHKFEPVSCVALDKFVGTLFWGARVWLNLIRTVRYTNWFVKLGSLEPLLTRAICVHALLRGGLWGLSQSLKRSFLRRFLCL